MKAHAVVFIVLLTLASPFATDSYAEAQDSAASTALPNAPLAAPQSHTEAASAGFFTRLGRTYVADWSGHAPTNPIAQPRRGTPAPLEHSFMHNEASLNIRNEYVDDIKGQRTGTPARYEEHMVGFAFWVGTTITFRPELSHVRAYGSYGARALDIAPGSAIANLENGLPQTGKNQALILASDLIWHF
jgi:hypothetical protein